MLLSLIIVACLTQQVLRMHYNYFFIFTEFVYVLHQKLFLQVNSIVSIHIIQSSLE